MRVQKKRVSPKGPTLSPWVPQDTASAVLPSFSVQIDPAKMKALVAYSESCRAPAQFKKLLEMLKICLPYEKLVCGWGDPQTYEISHVRTIDYPNDCISWCFATKMIKRDPVFHEWLKTREVQVWSDVFKKLAEQFDPEFIRRAKEQGLLNSITGGVIDRALAGYFVIAMKSYEDCHTYKQAFSQLLPLLYKALKNAYPSYPFTNRQKDILMRLAMGDQQKQITRDLKISLSTVKKHLSIIHQKLYSTTNTNAVWIATQRGLI